MIFLWCKNEQISVNQCESRGAAIKGIGGILWSTSHTKVQLTWGGFLNPAAWKPTPEKLCLWRLLKIWLVLNIHRCSSEKAKAAALSFMPILSWLPSYPVKKYLFSDVVSGLSTGVVQLPQGQWTVQQRRVKHRGCEQGRLRLQRSSFCLMLTLFWHRWHFDTVMESLNLQDCLFGNVLSSLLHRTSLRYAGCGASCLWSVLLLLPGPAVHLLWHVQTHISRWESRLCPDLMALCDRLCPRTRKQLQYARHCSISSALLCTPRPQHTHNRKFHVQLLKLHVQRREIKGAVATVMPRPKYLSKYLFIVWNRSKQTHPDTVWRFLSV